MRKSAIAVLVILALAAGSLAWMLGWVTDLIRPELDASAEWSRTYADALAPDAKIAVTYVPGGRDRPMSAHDRHGLFVSVRLSDATWQKPGAAEAVAFGIAKSAFERYGSDRPIEWVQTKLLHADRSLGRELAFARDESGTVAPVPYEEGGRLAPGASPPARGTASPSSGPGAAPTPREGGEAPRPPSIR